MFDATKLEWLGYRMVKKNYDNMLSRFHLIPERHEQITKITKLRKPAVYEVRFARTNKFRNSFILYALNNYV